MRFLALLLIIATGAFAQEVSKFPAQAPTDSDLLLSTDDFQSTLAVAMTVSSTSVILRDPIQPRYPSTVSIDKEIIKVCAGNSYTLLVCPGGRGFRSSPANHAKDVAVRGTLTAYHHNILAAYVESITAALGPNLKNVVSPAQLAALQTQIDALNTTLPAGNNLSTCSVATRGNKYFIPGTTGVDDTYQLCARDHAGVYAWHNILGN